MSRWSAVIAAAAAAALLSGCASPHATPTPSPGAPVARVGTTTITEAAFQTRLQSTITQLQQGGAPTSVTAMLSRVRATVLRSLILDTIIAQEAASAGIAATPALVQAQVEADAQAEGGMSKLVASLAQAGGSLAQLEDEIRSQLNEERLEDLFARQRAALVESQLQHGVPFAAVAAQLSDDTNTSAKGGDLGVISASQLAADDQSFATAVRSLAVGTYTTTPVRDSGGYDVIEVYARTATSYSVRHILVAAPRPYTVTSRPAWFSEALFATVAQLCTQGSIHIYITDAGANPCTGAPQLQTSPSPAG